MAIDREKFVAQYDKYRKSKEQKELQRFKHSTRTVKFKSTRKKVEFEAVPKYVVGMKSEFYSTNEWRHIRWEVLRASDMACVVCGRGRAHGIVLHVDHIKPRSKFPWLELVKSNLQVLCADCNIGKGSSI